MVATVAKGKSETGFGARLKALREAKGLTQEALGKRAGMRYQVIAKLERGAHDPKWATVLKLAAALGVDTDEFKDD